MANKKIGILGSGVVAQALATGFLNHGYKVTIGTSNPGKLKDWSAKNSDKAAIGSMEEAARFADIVVLAVKGAVAEGLVKQLAGVLAGKPVIDTTNPIAETPPVNGVISFTTDLNQSLMEKLQKAAPSASFVKAFNSVGSHLMVNPHLQGGQPTMFIAGNNDTAKRDVGDILVEFGWEIADMGKAEAARAIEPLCILWCIPGFLRNDWVHAFKVLKP